jgi:Holliday junction resolvasome RuvABC DNA-binding subunit
VGPRIGVGLKLASRLCLELKGKLDLPFLADATASAAPARPSPSDPLVLALARLDYKKSEIDRALSGGAVPGPEAPLDERLRAALRVLSPQA